MAKRHSIVNASIILFIIQYFIMVAPIPILSFTSKVPASKAFLNVTGNLIYVFSLILIVVVSSILFVFGFGKSDQTYSSLSNALALQGILTVCLYYTLCLIASGNPIEAVSLMFSGLASVAVPALQLLTSFAVNPRLKMEFTPRSIVKKLLTLLPITTLPIYYFTAQVYGQNIYTNTLMLLYFFVTVLIVVKITSD